MTTDPVPPAAQPSACSQDQDGAPPCPARRIALARTLALGLGALLDGEVLAAGSKAKWYPVSSAKGFALHRPRLVRFLQGRAAVFIVKVTNRSFVSFWAACTHDGVELTWNSAHPTIYHCRKHGAEFARDTGRVTHGPAKQPLPQLPVRVNKKNVVEVDLAPTGLV
ncbi:MAG: Rieske (2Fe-2S) protein [Gammaproteobacteria bacterium]|nr:Rieske (2Fe-2S) protein [Gammaproteobacteria bacterium]